MLFSNTAFSVHVYHILEISCFSWLSPLNLISSLNPVRGTVFWVVLLIPFNLMFLNIFTVRLNIFCEHLYVLASFVLILHADEANGTTFVSSLVRITSNIVYLFSGLKKTIQIYNESLCPCYGSILHAILGNHINRYIIIVIKKDKINKMSVSYLLFSLRFLFSHETSRPQISFLSFPVTRNSTFFLIFNIL